MSVIYFLSLSCLGLVITAQAQDCSRPVAGPNMNLKDNDINLQTFPDGVQVAFACDVGYKSAGGSPAITCTAGVWSSVKLRCQRKNCGPLDEVENGHIDYPEGTEFGDKVVITCKTGYKFVGRPGKREIFCGDGAWDGRLPVCEAAACDPPPTVTNGTFSPSKDSYAYGEVVQYSCQKGFTLSGSNSISCSDDGTFKPAPPTCTMVQCDEPDIKNAEWSGGSRPPYGYKSTVTFECRSGYTMIGERTLTCEINSQWSPGLPSCEPMACGPPPMVVDGTFSPSKNSYAYGDVVQYSCQKGFTLSGSNSITCSDNGTFKPAPPTCITMACGPPPMVVDGTFSPSKNSYAYGDVVQYSCQKGFTLSGSNSITCSDNGTFKPAPPTCIRKISPTKTTTTTKKPTVIGTSETPDNKGNSYVTPLVICVVVGAIGGIIVCGLCHFCGVPAFIKKKQGSRRGTLDNETAKPEEEAMV